jgi:hypothetical protein
LQLLRRDQALAVATAPPRQPGERALGFIDSCRRVKARCRPRNSPIAGCELSGADALFVCAVRVGRWEGDSMNTILL